jgi:hypothetical protein
MFIKRLVVTCGILAWLAASAWAGTIQDPAAWIDPGGGSPPFNGSAPLDPGAGIIDFYNNTGNLITSITLSTTLNTSLSPADISQFNCGSYFFLDCVITYDSGTGEFTMDFSGVLSDDFSSLVGSNLPDDGGDMGIPPLGHFVFDFFNDNGDSESGNGWIDNPTLFPTDTPELDATSAPEPGTSALLGAGLLALALISRRNYFSRSSRS